MDYIIIIVVILIITILYLLAIMPKLSRNPRQKNLEGWLYAHRGLHDNKSVAPENSLSAFAMAVEQGYGIELDVQLTKDLIPVVFHDYNLKRACNSAMKVSNLTYDELQIFSLFESNEKIPTLQQVLDLVKGRVPLIIEFKIPWSPDLLCEEVTKLLKNYNGVYCIESFNPLGLIWFKRHAPQVVRGQLATDFNKEKIEGNKLQYFILKHLLLNFLAKPDFIAYHHVYKNGLSFNICRKLYKARTVAWTIQNQEDFNNSKKYYTLFIFDSFIPKV